MNYEGLIKKYSKYLPVDAAAIVSLNEGNTPLLASRQLVKTLKSDIKLYYKLEGLNPTGSFKDRGMTYAVSKAVEAGSKVVVCASTGNTSAAAAAYAARAGLQCVVLIPDGQIALGKLSQAMIYGAKVFQVSGNFDEALNVVRALDQHAHITVVNSINPHRLTSQRTAAFEIVEQLGDAPDYHFIPVGNAGNITAYGWGYELFYQEKKSKKIPKMMGYQAADAAPIVLGKIVENPETIATAIRIGNPASWKLAEAVRDKTGGVIDAVTDAQILSAYQKVAMLDGYFCEPASAASIAGLLQYDEKVGLPKGAVVVCTLTGHGLKDPDTAMHVSNQPIKIKPDVNEILNFLS